MSRTRLLLVVAIAGGLLAVASGAEARRAATLTAAIGPGPVIYVETIAGAPVKTLRAGTYRFLVFDRSIIRNFHLRGPGVNKRTSVPRLQRAIWRLTLRPGRYVYFDDRHPVRVRGSFRVVFG